MALKLRPQRCGLGNHDVGKYGEPVLVKQRYVDTIRKMRRDFDSSYTVCSGCYGGLKRGIYNRRMDHKQSRASAGSSLEINTQGTSSSNGNGPLIPQPQIQQSSSSSSNGNGHLPLSQSLNQLIDSRSEPNSDTSSVSTRPSSAPTVVPNALFDGPSTSAAAATARQAAAAAAQPTARSAQRSIRFYLDSTQNPRRRTRAEMIDDAINERSQNVANGTRLPGVQPAPKRRRYVTANPDVMDIYVRGLKGG